jgi:predicted GIY-YIG superfamily endonuclease
MIARVEGYAATLQHLELLRRRRDDLRAKQARAEDQHLHRIACAYAAGQIDIDDLAVAYAEFKELADAGYSKAWNAAIPVSAAKIQSHIKIRSYREPNGPHGTWEGPFPFGEETSPGEGTSVVYVLFDVANVPCYVGSTAHFRRRLHQHADGGKTFVFWRAYPCGSRAEAYRLESRLLREHKPYLNKRAAA